MTTLFGSSTNFIKPTLLLKKRHQGIVVDNVDPQNKARIRVKIPFVLETADLERLPWIPPYRGAENGANPGNASHCVPEIGTQVYVSFPDNNPYSGFYEAAPITTDTAPPVAHSNDVPEAPADELPTENTDPSNSANIIFHGWASTRGDQNWVRIDKAQNKIELYLGEPKLMFSFDRGGNVQLKTPGNFDIEVGGKLSVKVGGDYSLEVGGSSMCETTGDSTLRTVGEMLLDVAKDFIQKVSGDRSATIGKDDSVAVGGSHIRDLTSDEKTTVGGVRTIEVSGSNQETVGGGQTVEITGNSSLDVSGNDTSTVSGTSAITASAINHNAGTINHNGG